MTNFWLLVVILFNFVPLSTLAQKNGTNTREEKLLPLFQIVTFPNDNCAGSTSRNGTCYTSEECSSKGGSSSGSCASGYGICCVFSLGCGSTSSENCTYLTQTSSTTTASCVYNICKCSSDICRIRFDFTTFSIAGPYTGTTGVINIQDGGALGDCLTDQFSITNPSGAGTPVICGFNTGQHMIVDASDGCHKASFSLGSSSSVTRSWDVKVTQFTCNQDLGGPSDCLQYFTGISGTISSFNFPTASTTVPATATHLSNQCYDMCIRRASGYCSICYVPIEANSATAAATITQAGFGLRFGSTPRGILPLAAPVQRTI
eukprot:maker-scaffold127_size327531-snap-gene-0.7 protein:Tk07868 transcript:maker-scaffold127_size327531-snap-gene-0.7-mRNA-1 annotation:"PREDICTED: uncharacterized protein LOC101744434"